MATRTDALASYTRDSGYGPTRTKTVTRRFEQRLRGVLQRINTAIRRGIVEEDIFNLQEETDTLEVDDPGPFSTTTDAATRVAFIQWLKNQLDSEFLTVVGRNRNQYIRRAYSEGIRAATSQLRESVDLRTSDVAELVERDRFDTGLRTLYTRVYENLESVAEDVTTAVRDELVEGYEKGENPEKIARRLTDRVDSIGKHRATTIARSETVHAHSEGFLDRTEQVSEDLDIPAGVRHVGRITALDDSVCSFCRKTSDSVFTIEEFRSTTVQFRDSVYRLAPPSHVNGRCSLQVEMGVDEDDLGPLSERVPGNIVT